MKQAKWEKIINKARKKMNILFNEQVSYHKELIRKKDLVEKVLQPFAKVDSRKSKKWIKEQNEYYSQLQLEECFYLDFADYLVSLCRNKPRLPFNSQHVKKLNPLEHIRADFVQRTATRVSEKYNARLNMKAIHKRAIRRLKAKKHLPMPRGNTNGNLVTEAWDSKRLHIWYYQNEVMDALRFAAVGVDKFIVRN